VEAPTVTKYDELIPALKRLLPAREVSLLGRAVQFVQRLRAIRASLFVWAVVLSRFGQGRPGFAEARHWYQRLGGGGLWPRPFQKRFLAPSSVALFEKVFARATETWRVARREIQHPLARQFADVVAWDSTVMQLSDRLARPFKGICTSVASISVFGLLPLYARDGRANQHDMQIFPRLDQFRAGTLWLFDKGYVAFERLRAIDEAGQYFLCPMRLNGNGRVEAVRSGPARVHRLLKDAAAKKRMLKRVLPFGARVGKTWDIDVKLWPNARIARDPRPITLRLVILPGPKGEQRPYLTNLDPERWTPKALRELYRLRWQIELVFKELKQHLNLESLPSANRYAVQVFAWASLIALAVSRTVATCLQPLGRMVGLASRIRPALVSRALRGTARLLAHVLTCAQREKLVFVKLFFTEVANEVRSREIGREDSFLRICSLLPARA
jgi:hypothetical protein